MAWTTAIASFECRDFLAGGFWESSKTSIRLTGTNEKTRPAFEANRPSLDALMQYMVEQHFIAKPIPLEDVFVPVDKALR